MTVTTSARLKITLDDVEPTVQRRVEVPLNIRLSPPAPGLPGGNGVDQRAFV